MRIGVNCYLLQPHIGGLKQYFFTLFRELLEWDHDNEYIFFWYPHNEAELQKMGADRWKEKAELLRDQRQVLDYIGRLDLYFCPFSVLYPRPLSIPTVMTLVDIQEAYYPEFFTPEDRYTRDLHFPSSTRAADRVITISHFSKHTLLERHRLPAEKVTVAYLSVDERYHSGDQIAQPPDYPLPRDYVFYPANFWRHKNHDCLLRALRLLLDEKAWKADAVFTGIEEENGFPIAEKIREYGLQGQTHILGYLTVEEMVYLYRRARMLVFPSLFEGFGIPLVEAMASGCPVVAANASSVPEVVDDAAELFDPTSPRALAQAIEKVWQNDALRQELIARGRIRAKVYSPARTAEAHLLAFREAQSAYRFWRYYWHHWVYQKYHRARVEFRWRKYRYPRFLAKLMPLLLQRARSIIRLTKEHL